MEQTLITFIIITLAVGSGYRITRQVGFVDLNKVERCRTPDKQTGICLTIRDCEPLVTLLRSQSQREEVREYLRKSVCGYEGTEPKVCCAQIRPPSPVTTVSPAPSIGRTPTPNDLQNDGPVQPLRGLPKPGQCGKNKAPIGTRVVGGTNATLGSWPWIAALGYRAKRGGKSPQFLCAGTLVTDQHLITAAHCIYNRDIYMARLGDLNLYEDNDGATPIDVLIESKKVHEKYNPTTFINDIAVLKLRRKVTFNDNIKPVCLPTSREMREMSLVNTTPFLAGWGSVAFNGPSSANLLQLQIPVVKESECKRAYTTFKTAVIDDRVLCAGYTAGGKDACRGDSGGPLINVGPDKHHYYLFGVVSYGYKCAEPGFPGVYTKVTSFVDWLVKNIE